MPNGNRQTRRQHEVLLKLFQDASLLRRTLQMEPAQREEVINSMLVARTGGQINSMEELSQDMANYAEVDQPGGKIGAAVQSAAQGATFNFADEMAGGLSGAMAAIFDPEKGFTEGYREGRDTFRAQQGQFREEHPALAFASELAGGVAVPGLGGAKLTGAVAKGLLPRIGIGAGIGLAEGGLAGLGAGEGGVTQQAASAALGAGLGGVLGGTVGAAGPLVGRATRRLLGQPSETQLAARAVAQRRLGQRGLQPGAAAQEVAARQAIDPGALVAEVPEITPLATMAVKSGSPRAGQLARETLGPLGGVGARTRGTTQRAREALLRLGGRDNVDAVRERVAAAQARRSLGQAEFAQHLGGQRANVTKEMADLFNRPSVQRSWRAARRIAQEEGRDIAPAIPKVGDLVDFPTMHYLRRALSGNVDRAFKSGVGDPSSLKATRDLLTDIMAGRGAIPASATSPAVAAIPAAFPGFGQALGGYRAQSRILDAFDEGRKIMGRNVDARTIQDDIARLRLDEGLQASGQVEAAVDAYRESALDAMLAATENLPAGRDPSRFFDTPNMESKIGALFGREGGAEFLARMGPEGTERALATAKRRIVGGSDTAENLSLLEEMSEGIGERVGAMQRIAEALAGQPALAGGRFVAQAGRQAEREARGRLAQRVGGELGEATLTASPERLAQLLRSSRFDFPGALGLLRPERFIGQIPRAGVRGGGLLGGEEFGVRLR